MVSNSLLAILLLKYYGLIVGIAKANQGVPSSASVGIWSKYVSFTGEEWTKGIAAESVTDWRTEIAVERREEAGHASQLNGPKALTKDGKIFLSLERFPAKNAGAMLETPHRWELVPVLGDVFGLQRWGKAHHVGCWEPFQGCC
ncbi:exo-alpha-sialidase [Trypanosoma cruzi]|nr:exo-alpha-sialidase [Trypanosoma cruzi]